MSFEFLKPMIKTSCFAVEDISGHSYLFDHDPGTDLRYPDEVDILFRYIVEGVFHPLHAEDMGEEGKLVGYILATAHDEYIGVYEVKGEHVLGADWEDITKEVLDKLS